MRRPSLRSQLNQVRLWVRQGRTDAWIAHKLDISVEQLEQFKREHRLNGEPEPARPEPAVEVAVPSGLEEVEEEPDEAPEVEDEVLEPETDEGEPAEEPSPEAAPEPTRRRRRGRRGGRRRAKTAVSYEASFDHGSDGYGLWLDPAITENEIYTEHWAGHRAVDVTIEPDAITIRRVEGAE